MPRYVYRCVSCTGHFEVIHGILDDHESCILCESKSIKRVPQILHIRREISSEGGKVGSEVKRAIDENRAILDEEKKKRVEYKDGN